MAWRAMAAGVMPLMGSAAAAGEMASYGLQSPGGWPPYGMLRDGRSAAPLLSLSKEIRSWPRSSCRCQLRANPEMA